MKPSSLDISLGILQLVSLLLPLLLLLYGEREPWLLLFAPSLRTNHGCERTSAIVQRFSGCGSIMPSTRERASGLIEGGGWK